MATYSSGTQIETVNSPKRNGTVTSFASTSGGQNYYTVHFDGDKSARYISESEIQQISTGEGPWEKLLEGSVKNHQHFGITSTFFKVKTIQIIQYHRFGPLVLYFTLINSSH